MLLKALGLSALLTLPMAALADIDVRFFESAPKDRFVFDNSGDCAVGPLEILVNLDGSKGALIFDTTNEGAGVEVFQPFEVAIGAENLISASPTTDGDQQLALQLRVLAPGGRFAFTIDVDDTLPASELGQIRVSGSEIAGAVVSINDTAVVLDASARGTAELPCAS